MTQAKSLSRPVRPGRRASGPPEDVLAWFRGEIDSPPWNALLDPGWDQLPRWWAEYQAAHPDARLPAGWIARAPIDPDA